MCIDEKEIPPADHNIPCRSGHGSFGGGLPRCSPAVLFRGPLYPCDDRQPHASNLPNASPQEKKTATPEFNAEGGEGHTPYAT